MLSGFQEVAVGIGSSAIAFNKDGTICYITIQNEGTVSIANVATLKEMMKIAVDKKPYDVLLDICKSWLSNNYLEKALAL